MLKKLMLFVIVGMFLITMASAEVETLGTFKKSNDVNLLQSGTGFTACNISSVRYPDGTSSIGSTVMVANGTEYEYALDQNYTSRLGTYTVNGFCTNGSSNTVWAYNFDVTTTGREDNPNFYYMFMAIIFILLTLGFYVQDLTLLRFGSMIMVLLGLYVIIYGFPGIKDAAYTWGIGIILVAIASYILIKSSHEAIEG